jgi:hypothetical protein
MPKKRGNQRQRQRAAKAAKATAPAAVAVAPAPRKTDAELLTGPLPPTSSPDYHRAVRLRMKTGDTRRKQEAAANSGVIGWLKSWVPGSLTHSPEQEEEEDEDEEVGDVGFSGVEIEGEGGGSVIEEAFGTEEAEEAEEEGEGGMKNPFAPSEIEITLAQGHAEKTGTAVGNLKGSANLKGTGEGGLRSQGKGSIEGRAGKAEGTYKGEITPEAAEGEGKVEFVLGATGEHKTGTLTWDAAGQSIAASGQLEGFAGAKGSVEARGKYDRTTGDVTAKAKAGAMIGAGAEGTVRLKIKTGEHEIATVEGKLGMHYGVGGEIYGEVAWKGGTMTFSTGGKVAAGVGVSYGYKIELDTTAMASAAQSTLGALWTWLTDWDPGDEDDFFVF